MSQGLGLYGGSFDPIHHGHLIIAREVAEQLGLARVLFLPSAQPPHKEATMLADAEHRAQMVRLAIAGEPLFELDEYDLRRPGPSYTIDTIRHVRNRLGGGVGLFWIIGADSLAELTTWREVAALVDSCRVVTAVRTGLQPIDWDGLRRVLGEDRLARLRQDVLPTPSIEISSTDLRRRVSEGRSIHYLTPDPVVQYIATHGLYRAADPGASSQAPRPSH